MDGQAVMGGSNGRARRPRGIPGPRRCGAHWGVADLYPDLAARLRAGLESGQPCSLTWRAGKAPACATVTRETTCGPISIEVRVHAGDEDLLTDSIIWSAFGGNAFAGSGRAALRNAGFGELTWEAVRSVLTTLGLFAPENAAHAEATVFCEASYDEVLAELEACERRAGLGSEARYEQAVAAACAEIRRWYALVTAGALRRTG
jgi:hypothetical protein